MIRYKQFLLVGADWLTQALVCAGAILCIAETISPWVQTTLFGRLALRLPGVLFADGALLIGLACGAVVLRRYRIAALVLAAFAFAAFQDAQTAIPRDVKSHIIAAQVSLSPINRLLDQANIPEITVGNFALPDSAYLAGAPTYAAYGIFLMMGGAVLGLAFDPLLVWGWRQFAVVGCRNCGQKRRASRSVDYCPACGSWQREVAEPPRCPVCRTIMQSTDNYCSSCGCVSPAVADVKIETQIRRDS